MKQMITEGLNPIAQLPFGEVARGILRDERGALFYVSPWGNATTAFPILIDGTLGKQTQFPEGENLFDVLSLRDFAIRRDSSKPLGMVFQPLECNM